MKYSVALGIVYCFFWILPLDTAMTGSGVEIYADSFTFVQGDAVTGDTANLTGTGGELSPTTTSGNTAELRGGFQAAERGILSYSLSAAAISIGPITTREVRSGGLVVSVSTDSETGYTLSMSEDGNIRSGSNDINDVIDGSVTAGSEEYGVRTSGSDGLLSSDTGISGSLLTASADGRVTSRETTILFSASASNNTVVGQYSHEVTFTVTVNP